MEQAGGWGGVNHCEWTGLGGNMRISNTKIAGKAGRKGCVNVSRSVSVCQSDPWALSKPPGRGRQAGCFLEKRIPSLAPLLRITPVQRERRLSKIKTSTLNGAAGAEFNHWWAVLLVFNSSCIPFSLYLSHLLTVNNNKRLSSLLMECMQNKSPHFLHTMFKIQVLRTPLMNHICWLKA